MLRKDWFVRKFFRTLISFIIALVRIAVPTLGLTWLFVHVSYWFGLFYIPLAVALAVWYDGPDIDDYYLGGDENC